MSFFKRTQVRVVLSHEIVQDSSHHEGFYLGQIHLLGRVNQVDLYEVENILKGFTKIRVFVGFLYIDLLIEF
jgi:hypothetical protein